VANRCLYNFH